ncbi:glycosyltransferase involved in cell wall biosynthesis [Gelidibacter algens]|uniref:Glycosyltransferase involved in cell wall biosynthesis n=1 Tax=Gelidibacter algens TaxID=49280 RepID=A0A1A7QWX0_9FLAO|nr:glycosyltransferase [Gelidibacter algens]OBX24510.1 hypothetical protein A9996_14970 [Gelidibacter algens]RAJ25334.1 glycosyltransferase involved in cell wall biosynthesis [Gelidibacter algens]
MKTICFFNSTDQWGGGEKWHLETCIYMQQQGYEVLFICNEGSELHKRLKKTTVEYVLIKITNLSFLNPFSFIKVKKILKQHHIDIIIMNLSRDLKVAGIAAKLAGVKRVIYRRGSAIPIKNSAINRYYFSSVVTDILANSIATKRTVLENNPNLFPEEKIEVIYNGIAIDSFLERDFKPVYNKKLDEFVLVNLGRLEFQKNQKFLIDIAQELKFRNLNFKLIIGGEGRLKDDLETLAQTLNVKEEILFPGFIKNPKDIMHSGDVFLLSSLWEGFGYVLAEAALCKKPIVAFNVSSNPEVVINNETGFLTPLNDVHLFADKIEYLYNNPEIRKEMGLKGYNFAINTFDSTKTQTAIAKYLIDA